MANFGFDQLHEYVVPPLGLLLTRSFYERRSIGRLNENRVNMAGDLFGVGHLNYIRHVDAGLRDRLGLRKRRLINSSLHAEFLNPV